MSHSNENIRNKKSNFLRQFRDGKTNQLRQLTADQFIQTWNNYDSDGLSMDNQRKMKQNLFSRIIIFPIKVTGISKAQSLMTF